MKQKHFDIAVIGSGFGGSLTAMIAHRLGYSTVMLERGRHPRFAIGESSTPLANLLLEEIATEYALPSIRPLCKWGSWQKDMPHLACGLKRGFTFYHHEFGRPFGPDPEHRRQLLVGASPRMKSPTRIGIARTSIIISCNSSDPGVEYLGRNVLERAIAEPNGMRLTGTRHGQPFEITAGFVVDASGPRGFLSRALDLPEEQFPSMPSTQASVLAFPQSIFRCRIPFRAGNQAPPYPPEQARCIMCFPAAGFGSSNSTTASAAPESPQRTPWRTTWISNPANRPGGDYSHGCLHSRNFWAGPDCHSFRLLARPTFRSTIVTGPHWALLPSAAGFVDPLLSTGFPLTLLGVKRIGSLGLNAPGPPCSVRLGSYSASDPARTRHGGTVGGYALLDDGPVRSVQGAQPALFRGRQFIRSRRAPRKKI